MVGTLQGQIKLVVFGDSTTARRENVVVYATLLKQWSSDQKRNLEVINAGIPANTTRDARKRFERDVLDRKPDIVVIQFGINDAAIDVWKTPPASESRVSLLEYEANLTYFIQTLSERGIEVILMTPNPKQWTAKMINKYGLAPYDPKDRDGFNLFLKKYAQLVRDIAHREQVPLVDVYREFERWENLHNITMADLLLDGIHPNSRGHQIVAGRLIEQLVQHADWLE